MKIVKIFLLMITISSFSQAQFNRLRSNEGMLGGGFGVTWIDDQPHYAFHLFPEIAFANFGIGLDLNLEYSPDGKIRTENFNEFSDYLSIIRYARYGRKNDPVYVRLGALDYATLGHGTIMYLYNNSPTYDARRIGLSFDVDFSTFGFESVYGNFGQAGVAGLRGYVRPLQFTDLRSIPIIGGVEVGATFVSDFDDKAGVISGNYNQQTNTFTATQDEGSTSILGFDIGLPILRTGVLDFDVYFDYNTILGFGSGAATGAILGFNGLGIVDARAKLERRFNGNGYVPAYFNALYELERFKLNKTAGTVSSKVQILNANADIGDGWYGELLVSIIGTFDILGSYQRLDDLPKSGMLHLSTEIAPDGFPYVARAGYDKTNIQSEKDIFTLDERSYLFAELGYKPLPYIIVSIVYNWTFTPVRDGDDNIIDYEPQKKIEPRVSFVYPLSF